MHIDEEGLQRFMHGELEGDEMPLRRHLATCTTCRKAFDDAVAEEDEVNELLMTLDHPLPELTAKQIIYAVKETARPRRKRGWLKAAAVVLLLGAAGAAYALPGSPVRPVIDDGIEWLSALIADVLPQDAADQDGSSPGADPDASGLGVDPRTDLTIQFQAEQSAGRVDIMLYDGDDVRVNAIDGAASFTSGTGRIAIDNTGSTARYEIRIPRDAPRVEVRIGGRRAYLKVGTDVTVDSEPSAAGVWSLRFEPGG